MNYNTKCLLRSLLCLSSLLFWMVFECRTDIALSTVRCIVVSERMDQCGGRERLFAK
ncbi:hypothetical protein BDR05DRAFT_329174 [Suillus weaverae]|nr:hypothetical protein BDR05DRAFT_329174 [Suillus weaverae]